MTHFTTQARLTNRLTNRRILAERAKGQNVKAIALVAVWGLTMALGVTVGTYMPITSERTYNLVEISPAGEADIIDYDLSATDCGFVADMMVRQGHNVACEKGE